MRDWQSNPRNPDMSDPPDGRLKITPTTLPDNAGLADELEELAYYLASENYYGSARTVRKAAEALRPSVWMDISTAPKDGTAIFIYGPSEKYPEPAVARWDSLNKAWVDNFDYHWGYDPVTHWMPLPTPPKAPTP